MLTNDEDRVLEVLDDLECRRLLTTARLGRLGFTEGALPAIVPVPFTLAADDLLIPAHHGHPVLAAMRGAIVAFAVDAYDVDARTGWGVTVVGPSRVLPGTGPGHNGHGVRGAGPAHPEEHCSIIVQMRLLRGWRMGLPAVPVPS